MKAPGQEAAIHSDELLAELDQMLREQIEASPFDIKLRVRLAKLKIKMGDADAFVQQLHHIETLTDGQLDHPAMREMRAVAHDNNIDLVHLRAKEQHRPQRRLGEDPASKKYFADLDQKLKDAPLDRDMVLEWDRNLVRASGRPSSLMLLQQFSEHNRGARLALKREDVMGPGSKLTMAVAGQCLLARRLGFSTVATGSPNPMTGAVMSSIAARLGLRAVVFLSQRASDQNSVQVLKMRAVGARVNVTAPHDNPRDAALDLCIKTPDKYFMVMGVDGAPPPFPEIQRLMVSALGRETRSQCQSLFHRQPDLLVARGERTADAIGFFDPFLKVPATRLVCVNGRDTLTTKPAQFDPFSTNVQLTDDQLRHAEAILEGSEYPAVTREHRAFKDSARVEYVDGASTDAIPAIKNLARLEGLICPIRTAYAVGWAARAARQMPEDHLVVICMVEPYDKDLREVAKTLGADADTPS